MSVIWTSRTRTRQPIGPSVSVASDISPPAWLTLPVPGGMESGYPGAARNLVRPHEVAVGQDAFNYFRQISTPAGLAAENFAISSAGATQWLVTTDALCGATQLTLLCALYRRGAIDESAQWLNFRTDNVHSMDVFASTATTLTFGADWAGAWNGTSQQTVTVGDGLVTIAVTIRQDGARFFCNGRATGTKTGSSWSVGSTPYQVSINRGARSPILMLAAWKTALPDSQIAALSANPWKLFRPERKPVFYSLGVSGSTVTGVGSIIGAGAASGIGASTAASVGSTTGTGTASGVGSSSSAGSGVGSTSGTGSASGVGASTAAATGSTSGVGTATGVGASIAATVGSASGTGTSTGVGANGTVTTSAVGSASGSSVVLGVSPSHGGGTGKGQNLSRKQKKKLKAVESQEWLKAEETARQLLNDRFTKQTPQEKAEALQTYVESLQPVIDVLKALTVAEKETVEKPIIELTPHQELLTRFDTLEKKLKSVEELVIILMADL